MSKYWFVLLSSVTMVVLSACGVPQEQFDNVVTELTKTQNQQTTLQGDNEKLTQEVTELQNELTTSRERVSELENRLQEVNKNGEELRNLASILAGFMVIGVTEDFSGLLELLGQVGTIKDPAIRAKGEKAFAASGRPEEDQLIADWLLVLGNRILNLAK